MTSKPLWLHICLSSNLSGKKKVKIRFDDGDYETAFNELDRACRKRLQSHIKSGELPNLVMVYKPESDLDGAETDLTDAEDLEGMLDEYPEGKDVRVIINTHGKH